VIDLAFGPQRILRLRSHLRLTQRAFAKEVGVSQPTVAKWEGGIREPSGAEVLSALLRLENGELPEREEVKAT